MWFESLALVTLVVVVIVSVAVIVDSAANAFRSFDPDSHDRRVNILLITTCIGAVFLLVSALGSIIHHYTR